MEHVEREAILVRKGLVAEPGRGGNRGNQHTVANDKLSLGARRPDERAMEHVEREAILVRKGLVAEPGRGGNRGNQHTVANDKLSLGARRPDERAMEHVEREAILVRKGLVAEPTHGGDRRSSLKSRLEPSYSEQASKSLGLARSTVQRDLQRGRKIASDILTEVVGAGLGVGISVQPVVRLGGELGVDVPGDALGVRGLGVDHHLMKRGRPRRDGERRGHAAAGPGSAAPRSGFSAMSCRGTFRVIRSRRGLVPAKSSGQLRHSVRRQRGDRRAPGLRRLVALIFVRADRKDRPRQIGR